MIIPEGALPHLPVRLSGFETAAGSKLDSLRAEENGFAFHFGDSSAVVRDIATPANNANGDVNSVLTYTSPSTKNIFNQLGVLESGTTIRCDHDPATKQTSTTEHAISINSLGLSKTFTVADGTLYSTGQCVRASDTSNSTTNFYLGTVSGTTATTVTIAIEAAEGSGTISDWTVIRALGALIEPAATNSFNYSHVFDGSWLETATSPTATTRLIEEVTDPVLGDVTKITESSDNDVQRIYSTLSCSVATNYVYSLYYKSNGRAINIRLTENNGIVVQPDGTVSYANGTLVGYGSKEIGGGWFRIWISYNTASTSTTPWIGLVDGGGNTTYTGDGSSGVFVANVQFEPGTVPTSPIITTGTAVTRAADRISEMIANLPWSEDVMCLMGCFTPRVLSTSEAVWGAFFDFSNRITYTTSSLYHPYVNDGGVVLNMDAGTVIAGAENKFAVRLKDNDLATVLNGGAAVAYASGTVPTGLTELALGSLNNIGSGPLNGHLLWFKGVPRDISNADLEAEVA